MTYLSTEHDNTMPINHNRHDQPREKPLLIVKYNSYMKGVDSVDQMRSYYPCKRNTLRWYKKVFIHIFQVIVVNGWALFNEVNSLNKVSLYDYRLQIIRALLHPQV